MWFYYMCRRCIIQIYVVLRKQVLKVLLFTVWFRVACSWIMMHHALAVREKCQHYLECSAHFTHPARGYRSPQFWWLRFGPPGHVRKLLRVVACDKVVQESGVRQQNPECPKTFPDKVASVISERTLWRSNLLTKSGSYTTILLLPSSALEQWWHRSVLWKAFWTWITLCWYFKPADCYRSFLILSTILTKLEMWRRLYDTMCNNSHDA